MVLESHIPVKTECSPSVDAVPNRALGKRRALLMGGHST